jgi:hypothetical protein
MKLESIIAAGRWCNTTPRQVTVEFPTAAEAKDFMAEIALRTGMSLPWREVDPNPGRPSLHKPGRK